VGEVADPQLVRLSRGEIPPNQIGVPIRPGRGSGGTHFLPSPHISDLLGTNQPGDLVTVNLEPVNRLGYVGGSAIWFQPQ